MSTEGNKANFWVQIQSCQNQTWQGKLTYIENNEVKYFRSALELLKLIDSAVADQQEAEGTQAQEQQENWEGHKL